MTLQVQLVDARLGVFVGLGAVGVERLQQLLAAGVQLVGAQSGIQEASWASAAIHRCGSSRPAASEPSTRATTSTCRTLAAPASNTAAVAGSRAGSGVPSSPTRGRTCSAALRCRSGLGAFPPEQIGQRGRAGAVAALAERAATFEIGERGHTGLIEGATHALAEGQHPEQIGLARRLARGIPQHLDRLAEQAARDFQRAFRHLSIVSEHMFDQVLLSTDVYGDAASSCTVSRGIGTAKTSATTWLQPCTK